MALKVNVGMIDAIGRLAVGVGIIYWTLVSKDMSVELGPSALLILIGLTFIVTAALRYCPFYALVGFNSRKKN